MYKVAIMKTNDFRGRLRAGDTLLGTIITLPMAATAEVLTEAGFDWLFLDAEHGSLEYSDILSILQAVGDQVSCIVRLPAAEEVPIKKVLDLGAAGIIAPQVNSVEQARDVVRFARYSPTGSRGVGLARAHGYGMRFSEYLESANDQVAVIVQVEHIDAVESIDEIVQIEGIDGIMLGPYDLSASLGKMGELDHPTVVEAIEKITRTCKSVGMPMGVFGVTTESLRPYMKDAYTLILAGVDTMLLGSAAKDLLEELQSEK